VNAYLVEHYWPGITAQAFGQAVARVRAAVEAMAGEGHGVRLLHSTVVLGDESAFTVLAATSASVVEDAYRRAGVRFDRLVDAVDDPRVPAAG
jgi:hypothetical protein